MRVKLNALHQLFCQRQNLILGAENMVNGYAASNLLEVQKLHFQCQRSTLEVILLDASDQFEHSMIQMDGNGGILIDVRFKRLLTADTLPLPLTDDRPIVDASREIIEHKSHLAELLSQPAQ